MPRHTPSHRKQILGTKHRPNEQMCPKRRTRRHDTRKHNPSEQRQQRDMAYPNILAILRTLSFDLWLRQIAKMRMFGLDPAPLRLSIALRQGAARRTSRAVTAEQTYTRDTPVHRPGPVREEHKESYGEDVVPAYAVVGI